MRCTALPPNPPIDQRVMALPRFLAVGAAIAVTIVTLAYPLLVYLGLRHFEPRQLVLLLVGVALARAGLTRQRFWLVAAAGAALLGLASLLGNAVLPLKLYPVLVNGVLLGVFGASLRWPPSAPPRSATGRCASPGADATCVRASHSESAMHTPGDLFLQALAHQPLAAEQQADQDIRDQAVVERPNFRRRP